VEGKPRKGEDEGAAKSKGTTPAHAGTRLPFEPCHCTLKSDAFPKSAKTTLAKMGAHMNPHRIRDAVEVVFQE
jgi:hypothetical protein